MGKETDVVFLSTTRTNTCLTEETEEFFSDQNRMAVALTRAKEGMIIFGSQRVFKNFCLWENFCELFKRIEIVFLDEFVKYLGS